MELATFKIYCKLNKSYEYNKCNITETLNTVQQLRGLSKSHKEKRATLVWEHIGPISQVFMIFLQGPYGPTECPLAGWSLSWHGWHTG